MPSQCQVTVTQVCTVRTCARRPRIQEARNDHGWRYLSIQLGQKLSLFCDILQKKMGLKKETLCSCQVSNLGPFACQANDLPLIYRNTSLSEGISHVSDEKHFGYLYI